MRNEYIIGIVKVTAIKDKAFEEPIKMVWTCHLYNKDLRWLELGVVLKFLSKDFIKGFRRRKGIF